MLATPHALPSPAIEAMQQTLHQVAADTIEAVVTEVPAYRGELGLTDRATLAQAVEQALRGFLALAAEERDPSAPLSWVRAGAYALGRGEARAGRSLDALLSAYRVGARVSWRRLAGAAVDAGLPAEGLVAFAELVFAYIDELSASSVTGHADELAIEGRMRQRHLERLAHGLVAGAEEQVLVAAAQAAGWSAPGHLVAVVLDEAAVEPVLARADPRTLQPIEDVPGLVAGEAVLLIPESGASPSAGLRSALVRAMAAADPGPAADVPPWAVVGPTRPWLRARSSFERALRARREGIGRPPAAGALPVSRVVATEELLPELVVSADPDALADLRTRALQPLEQLRPAQVERLTLTLRSWLLHRGRREEVAAELFVHPQTVRYRIGQLRELFGDALEDPRSVLELTIALTAPLPSDAAAD